MTDERMAPEPEGPRSVDASDGSGLPVAGEQAPGIVLPGSVDASDGSGLPVAGEQAPGIVPPGSGTEPAAVPFRVADAWDREAWPSADARPPMDALPAAGARATIEAWPVSDARSTEDPAETVAWVAADGGGAQAPGPDAGSWAASASARAHLSAGGPEDGRPGAPRAADGRLARLHLRGGLLTLARASLEQMAGVGALDREALADLAEARWRSGDLEGAAEAAAAHLDAGGDEPLAHLVVAEEADRQGSLVDARRHAAVVRERVGTGLDRLFAGETRSTAWPLEGVDWMDDGATAPGRWGLLAGGREIADPQPRSWRMLPPPASGSPVARPRIPLAAVAASASQSTLDQMELGRAAGIELEAAENELARGAISDALDRLALVLRFDPALAPVILSMADRALAGPGDHQQGLVALHVLRGDAYRGLGRELEAVDAYQESMRALTARATPKESQ